MLCEHCMIDTHSLRSLCGTKFHSHRVFFFCFRFEFLKNSSQHEEMLATAGSFVKEAPLTSSLEYKREKDYSNAYTFRRFHTAD